MNNYLPIQTYASKSTPGVRYTVCIRTNGGEPILTCNCPGWTRRCPTGEDSSRTCRHVLENGRALEQYKTKGAVVGDRPLIISIRETMPTVREVVEIRSAREWLGLDEPVEAQINRFSRAL